MSRRRPQKPASAQNSILPGFLSLRLAPAHDIGAKRNTDKRPQEDEDTESELAEQVKKNFNVIKEMLRGEGMDSLTAKGQDLLDAQPCLFGVDIDRVATRRAAFEVAMRQTFNNHPFCPKMSPAIRYMQSILSHEFCIFLDKPGSAIQGNPSDAQKEAYEEGRQKTKAVLKTYSALTGAPQDEEIDYNQHFLNLDRLILFGDIENMAFAGRDEVIQNFDKRMQQPMIDLTARNVILTHFTLMYRVAYSSSNKNQQSRELLDTPSGNADPEVNTMFKEVCADLGSSTTDNGYLSKIDELARCYWNKIKPLLKAGFDKKDDMDALRSTAPDLKSPDSEWQKASDLLKNITSYGDKLAVQCAFVKAVVDIESCRRENWGWFATSAACLFAFFNMERRPRYCVTKEKQNQAEVIESLLKRATKEFASKMRTPGAGPSGSSDAEPMDDEEPPPDETTLSEQGAASSSDTAPSSSAESAEDPAQVIQTVARALIVLNPATSDTDQMRTVLRSDVETGANTGSSLSDTNELPQARSPVPLTPASEQARSDRITMTIKESVNSLHENKELKELVEKLLGELRKMKENKDKAIEIAKKQEERIGDLQGERRDILQQLEDRKKEVEKTTADAKTELGILLSKLGQKRADLASERTKNVQLQNEVDKLEAEKEEAENKLKELQDEAADIDEVTKESEKKDRQINELQKQVEEKTAKCVELDKKISDAANRRATNSISESSNAHKAKQSKFAKSTIDLTKAFEKIKKSKDVKSKMDAAAKVVIIIEERVDRDEAQIKIEATAAQEHVEEVAEGVGNDWDIVKKVMGIVTRAFELQAIVAAVELAMRTRKDSMLANLIAACAVPAIAASIYTDKYAPRKQWMENFFSYSAYTGFTSLRLARYFLGYTSQLFSNSLTKKINFAAYKAVADTINSHRHMIVSIRSYTNLTDLLTRLSLVGTYTAAGGAVGYFVFQNRERISRMMGDICIQPSFVKAFSGIVTNVAGPALYVFNVIMQSVYMIERLRMIADKAGNSAFSRSILALLDFIQDKARWVLERPTVVLALMAVLAALYYFPWAREQLKAAKKKALRLAIDTAKASKQVLPYLTALRKARLERLQREAQNATQGERQSAEEVANLSLLFNAGDDSSGGGQAEDATGQSSYQVVRYSPTRLQEQSCTEPQEYMDTGPTRRQRALRQPLDEYPEGAQEDLQDIDESYSLAVDRLVGLRISSDVLGDHVVVDSKLALSNVNFTSLMALIAHTDVGFPLMLPPDECRLKQA